MNFNSHTSYEVWQEHVWLDDADAEFQLTHLLRGVTVPQPVSPPHIGISTHTPPCEVWLYTDFGVIYSEFQLTHLLRGVTLLSGLITTLTISTHILIARCDITRWKRHTYYRFQLTHPLWSVTLSSRFAAVVVQFQLTHLLWGVTCTPLFGVIPCEFQLTHLLRGVTNQIPLF